MPSASGAPSRALTRRSADYAKTARDRLMAKMAEHWPDYGFAGHKGYGTAAHAAALTATGPCPLHRVSFRPVRAALDPD